MFLCMKKSRKGECHRSEHKDSNKDKPGSVMELNAGWLYVIL